MVDDMNKTKVVLRLGVEIREILDGEALVQDVRTGTLANRVLREELDKVMRVGVDKCLIVGSRDYLAAQAGVEQNRKDYYLFPAIKTTANYITTQLDKSYPQFSFYVAPEELDVLQQLVRKQRIAFTIRDDGSIKSYRYVIAGMLLNNPLLSELGAGVNS